MEKTRIRPITPGTAWQSARRHPWLFGTVTLLFATAGLWLCSTAPGQYRSHGMLRVFSSAVRTGEPESPESFPRSGQFARSQVVLTIGSRQLLQAVVDEIGAGRILAGSDHPPDGQDQTTLSARAVQGLQQTLKISGSDPEPLIAISWTTGDPQLARIVVQRILTKTCDHFSQPPPWPGESDFTQQHEKQMRQQLSAAEGALDRFRLQHGIPGRFQDTDSWQQKIDWLEIRKMETGLDLIRLQSAANRGGVEGDTPPIRGLVAEIGEIDRQLELARRQLRQQQQHWPEVRRLEDAVQLARQSCFDAVRQQQRTRAAAQRDRPQVTIQQSASRGILANRAGSIMALLAVLVAAGMAGMLAVLLLDQVTGRHAAVDQPATEPEELPFVVRVPQAPHYSATT